MEYKLPEIRDYEGDITKRWAVYYYVEGERKVEWISNKIKTRKGRYLEAEKIIREISGQLKKNKTEIKVTSKQKLVPIIINALAWKKLYVSQRTYQSYENISYKLIDWLRANHPDISWEDFTKFEANKFIEETFTKSHYEAKTINCTVGYLHTIFARIMNVYPIPVNPFKMEKLIENEPDINTWTEDLKKKVSRHLKKKNPELFIILLLVYHCYLRPDEIRKIQCKNIDLVKGTIKITSKKGKSNSVKFPTLSKQLIKLLTPYVLNFAPETFIFSKGLKPGKYALSRNMITMRFKKIREDLGISEEFKLYHFKHTGNSEMIEKGLNIRDLQQQNGHSSLSITEKYLKRFGSSANKKIVSLTKEL